MVSGPDICRDWVQHNVQILATEPQGKRNIVDQVIHHALRLVQVDVLVVDVPKILSISRDSSRTSQTSW